MAYSFCNHCSAILQRPPGHVPFSVSVSSTSALHHYCLPISCPTASALSVFISVSALSVHLLTVHHLTVKHLLYNPCTIYNLCCPSSPIYLKYRVVPSCCFIIGVTVADALLCFTLTQLVFISSQLTQYKFMTTTFVYSGLMIQWA